MAYERRDIVGGAAPTTLSSGINSGAMSFSIDDPTGWPQGSSGDFFVVMDRGTATEEKILCASRTGSTVTVASGGRGVDGTSAASHLTGATVEHCIAARDLDEANAHLANEQADPHPQYPLVAVVTAEIAAALDDYLPLAGGTLTGTVTSKDIDMDGNDLIDPVVTNAVDKVYSADISGSVTIDAANGGTQILTLTGNVTAITVSNLASGGGLDILLIEGGSGSYTIAWPAAWYWGTSEAVATSGLSTSLGARHWLALKRFGSEYHAGLNLNMTT